jgi:hypothetical protein
MLPTRGIRAKLWLWATANSVVAMLIENVLRGGVYVSGQARLFALQAAMARRLHHLNKLRGIRAALESRA